MNGSGIGVLPAFELVGYRHVETGILRSIRFVQHDPGEAYDPVFTGGPTVAAPLLEALIHFVDTPQEQFHGLAAVHQMNAARALGEFVDFGGQLP